MILFLKAFFLIWCIITLLWVWSVRITNASIVDIFWGLGFVVVNTFYVFHLDKIEPRNLVLLILVAIWGLRLTMYLAFRNIGKGEDYRYQEFRKNYGEKRYWWFSYFQVFLLQGVLILIVSLPLFGVHNSDSSGQLFWLDYMAILTWVIGFIFEAGGDYQLYQFKKSQKNKEEVLTKGFWKYTRHPNYFGDAFVWWSYAMFSMAAGGYWQIIGAIVMTLLIIKVSGVALLEKTLKNTKPKYKEYVEKTNSFFPWFPKK
jgi:steroid 5-alpha reductase family enzyme